MATIKIKFRASSSEEKEGTLFYRVIHRRVTRQVHTGYKLRREEWDDTAQTVVIPSGSTDNRRSYLATLRESVRGDRSHLEGIVRRLERAGNPYTADDVVKAYLSPGDDNCLVSFGRNLVGQLKKIGKGRVAEHYSSALNSFRRFIGEKDIPLDNVDSDLMVAYESHLKGTGICLNTVSYYLRNLRAIYNRAVEKGLTEQRFPFRHVYTGIDKTEKRAVPIRTISKIRGLDLTLRPALDYARDLFLFSFYTRGMSFVDVAYLKKTDLRNGVLTYRRHKTGQRLSIKWEKPMQEIVDKYDTADSPYLLPIIKPDGTDERRQYVNAEQRVNRNLKKVGDLIGLAIPLTTYVARHGWASIAWSKNIPISTISEALGHDSENTTRIYVASLDTSEVDKANKTILNSL